MGRVFIEQIEGIPRIVCTDCSSCTSVMGQSLYAVKNRGCCSYFPEFQLSDIHYMCKSAEGLNTLENILQMPGTEIYQYYIHVKGSFDRNAYEEYLKGSPVPGSERINDHTIFFRACPFVKPGHGCSLPPKFRNHICNFFVCEEILGIENENGLFREYLLERARYVNWIYRENNTLRHILSENGINLKDNYRQVIELLQEIPWYEYEFPPLDPVETETRTPWLRGA